MAIKTYSKLRSMYCFHEEKEPVIIRLKTKPKPCEKVQGFSKSSISNLSFGGMNGTELAKMKFTNIKFNTAYNWG